MTVSGYEGPGAVQRSSGGGLVDVIDTILDKGLVIDAYVRVSLVGIEILNVDARVVVASVDTYLRFAEAVNRLDISQDEHKAGLPDLVGEVTEGGSRHKTKGALEAAGEKLSDLLGEAKSPSRERERAPRRSNRRGE